MNVSLRCSHTSTLYGSRRTANNVKCVQRQVVTSLVDFSGTAWHPRDDHAFNGFSYSQKTQVLFNWEDGLLEERCESNSYFFWTRHFIICFLKEKVTPIYKPNCINSPKFQPLKCRFSLWNSFPERSPALEHRCLLPFRLDLRGFIQMSSEGAIKPPLWLIAVFEPYYFEPNMLQTPKW